MWLFWGGLFVYLCLLPYALIDGWVITFVVRLVGVLIVVVDLVWC